MHGRTLQRDNSFNCFLSTSVTREGLVRQGYGDGRTLGVRHGTDGIESTSSDTYTHSPGEEHTACHAGSHGGYKWEQNVEINKQKSHLKWSWKATRENSHMCHSTHTAAPPGTEVPCISNRRWYYMTTSAGGRVLLSSNSSPRGKLP